MIVTDYPPNLRAVLCSPVDFIQLSQSNTGVDHCPEMILYLSPFLYLIRKKFHEQKEYFKETCKSKVLAIKFVMGQ